MIELLIALAIIGILLSFATYLTQEHQERLKNVQAISDVRLLSDEVQIFRVASDRMPTSISELPDGGKLDPWGHAYQFLDIEGNPGSSAIRTSGGTALNTDFDLYSMGKDGATSASLGASNSQDDLVRGRNGKYIGLGKEY